MKPLFALVGRDLRLAARVGGDGLTLVLFFVMVGVIVPFAIGPDKATLARLAPGIVWIAAFLSMLLGLDRMFRADADDGSLHAFRHAGISLQSIVVAKVMAHWLLSALPLLAATPVLAILLNMDFDTWLRTLASLALGTPALVALGAIGASLTVSLKRGGLIAPVLILPLAVPVLIFGVAAINGAEASGTALLLLCAISLVLVALSPFASALALRVGED